jgi:hypothetical protein
MKPGLLLLAQIPLLAAGSSHFTVTAVHEPSSRPGISGAVAVTFRGTDPEIHINEEPAPRLKLDPAQVVLVDKQAPSSPASADFDPEAAHYLDLSKAVRFPVEIAAGAPKGDQLVKATVTYFYCSKREGWCRRGSTEVEVPVTVK